MSLLFFFSDGGRKTLAMVRSDSVSVQKNLAIIGGVYLVIRLICGLVNYGFPGWGSLLWQAALSWYGGLGFCMGSLVLWSKLIQTPSSPGHEGDTCACCNVNYGLLFVQLVGLFLIGFLGTFYGLHWLAEHGPSLLQLFLR